MTFRKFTALLVVLSCTALSNLRAGTPLDYYLPAGTTYNPAVPTPEQFLGWQIGDWHLRSELSTAYLRAVAAAAPDRVKFEIIGYTYEQKPLVVLTITAPGNHKNLTKIRADHLVLLDPAKSATLDIATMPAVVDLGYSIHGNEASGTNAMPLIVYYLAAAQGPKIDALLKDTVILIEAQRNPDGGDRFAQWVNSNRSFNLSADPASREHNELWPRGRFNHYLFDPNRDWWPLVHPEARARAELFHSWRPNILTDHHEMGTNGTFFFQPGVESRNQPSAPARVYELNHKIAAFHQRALDGKGVFYYSEQGFDDFYPGKGSTYPDLHGCVGILFEQASARGHVQESENGELTFAYAIRNHVLSSLSTLDAAVALRPELLALEKEFTAQTLELARKDKVKAYVFSADGDPARASAFLDLMARHRIEVRPLKEVVTAEGRTYQPGAAWAVLTEQPQYRVVTEAFTKRTVFGDTVFYDVSGWTLPLAFNLPYAAIETTPAAGDVVGLPKFPAGKIIGGRSDYAYLFNWNGYYAPRALHRLQKAGIMVKGLTTTLDASVADGTTASFGYGAVLVPVGLQPEKAKEIAALVETITREDGVTVYAVASGLTPHGVDLGSPSFVPLKKPEVALVTGEGVDPSGIGGAWHVLDTRVGVAATLIDLPVFNRTNLSRYNVIVMAEGNYDSVTDAAIVSLQRWVREGGTLLLSGRAGEWAAKKGIAAIEYSGKAGEPAATAGGRVLKTGATEDNGEKTAPRRAYASGSDLEAQKLVAGAIFAVTIDPTHPLGYGYAGDSLSVFRQNTLFMKPAKSPYETPVVYPAQPLLSGFISAENLAKLANSAAVVALPTGRGVVIAMTDDPNFRGIWYGGNRMFFNAIFYGRAIRAIRANDDGAEAH